VEDSEDDARMVVKVLQRAGYKVQKYEIAGTPAATQAAMAREPWDAVISDYSMPDFNGLDALAIVRAKAPDIPFILISGSVGEEIAVDALKAGVGDYVLKKNLQRLPLVLERELREAATRTEHRQIQRHLIDSEQRLRTIIASEPECVKVVSREGALLEMNPAGLAMLEADSLAAAQSRSLLDFIAPEHRAAFVALHQRVIGGESGILEFEVIGLKGGRRWLETHATPLSGASGEAAMLLGVTRDITEHKAALAKIDRLNRVYAMLSGINSAIVRIRERDELLQEACRIAVAEGGFILARVLALDSHGTARIAATTESDSSTYQRLLDQYNSDPEHSQALIALALRSGQPLISNDVANDARIPDRAALTKDGNYSLALLPIVVETRVAGALVLRARVAGTFDEDEQHLLGDLVANLSFALDHIEKAKRLDYLAYYDSLTGLANRNLFHERLTQYIQAERAGKGKLALILANLERFKTINDSLGRQAGDAVLKQLAERLGRAAEPARVARVGGDHFAVVLPGIKGRSEAGRKLEEIWQDCFAQPFRVGDTELRLAAKAGVSLYPNDGANADTLLGNAEAALKRAKETGEPYVFHALEMTAKTGEKLTLENSLRQALGKDEFVLHYQPKVDLVTRRIVAVEALIRWQSPELGLVPPGHFIPLMEETGMILEVGAWALARAVSDHARWHAMGVPAPRIAVNVSAIQLRRRDFVAGIEKALAGGARPPGIDLEITESLIMEDIEGNIGKLKAARALGMSIAIDDFGTGYSSLAYLAKLPIQTLKIDRSFVITMLANPDTMTLVSTIISLAHSLRLNVVAEGVEVEDQAKMLRLLRCDEMQGYLFSRPVPFDAMTALLAPTAQTA
jgi:diguanylate cyclase (GGDEF)-like protein/PAS domain S-box-containing protein